MCIGADVCGRNVDTGSNTSNGTLRIESTVLNVPNLNGRKEKLRAVNGPKTARAP